MFLGWCLTSLKEGGVLNAVVGGHHTMIIAYKGNKNQYDFGLFPGIDVGGAFSFLVV